MPKGLKGWIEVFKAGTHTDSEGRSCTFSTADLDQMVANVSLGKPPAVLGHPKHDEPAYAWAALKRDGDSLYAKFTDIHPAFEAGVDSGAYRNRSIKAVKDKQHGWRCVHIGFLGAVPPAIDGLKPLQYAAPEGAEVYEFSAPGYSLVWGVESLARLLRGLREEKIARDGIEAADQVLPQWQIDNAMEAAAQARQQFEEHGAPAFSQHPTTGGSMPTPNEQELQRAREEAAASTRAEMTAQFSAQSAELDRLRAERQTERIGVQINGWKAAGKLLPAEEPGLVQFMVSLEGGGSGEFTFSAPGTTGEVKKTPAQWFAAFMAARAPAVQLGKRSPDDDRAPAVDQSDYRAIANAALEFKAAEAKAGREIGIDVAVAHVTRSAATR